MVRIRRAAGQENNRPRGWMSRAPGRLDSRNIKIMGRKNRVRIADAVAAAIVDKRPNVLVDQFVIVFPHSSS